MGHCVGALLGFAVFSNDRWSPRKLLYRHTAVRFFTASSTVSPSLLASRSKASLGIVVSMLAFWLPVVRILYRLIITSLSVSLIVCFSNFFTSLWQKGSLACLNIKKSYTRKCKPR